MKKPSFSLTALLHNRRFIAIVSVVLSVGIWYAVVSGPANIQERTLTIPVSVDLSNTYAETIGLRLTGEASTDVSVVVQGQWSVISRLTAADLRVRANVSSVQKAGKQDVPLTVGYNSANVNYEILSLYPDSISITCDYWETEVLRVQVDTSMLTAADGTQLGTPILDPAVTTDGTLTLSGPKSQLDRIRTLIARIPGKATLSDVRVFEAALQAYDEDGTEVPLTGCSIGGLDTHTINVTVPVWVTREVPLHCTLKNAPAFFTRTSDRITVTPASVKLLGPANTLDTLTDLGDLGVLDFDSLSPETTERELELSLPDSVQIVSGETKVKVSVNLSGFTSKTLTFTPSASNVQYSNNTSGRQTEVQPRDISVTLIGSEASLASLTEEALWLTVDLTGAAQGTAAYNARFQVVGYDDVWVCYGEGVSGTSVYVTLS